MATGESITQSKKTPLKTNVFECARNASAQLLPLFPYLDEGSIVPCCAAFESDGSGMKIGYFLHENTVDEIVVNVASNGQQRTGDVFVGPREHGVGGESSEAYYALQIITQRQMEEGTQTESMAYVCEKCAEENYRYRFDDTEGNPGGNAKFPGLPTIAGSAQSAMNYNMSEENRTCKSCGHVSDQFPLPIWGWGNYAFRSGIIEKAAADFYSAGE